MRAFCATAALCLAVAFVPSAQALASARHHHARHHVVPLPPERPAIEDLFPVQNRLVMNPESSSGRFSLEPDGHSAGHGK